MLTRLVQRVNIGTIVIKFIPKIFDNKTIGLITTARIGGSSTEHLLPTEYHRMMARASNSMAAWCQRGLNIASFIVHGND